MRIHLYSIKALSGDGTAFFITDRGENALNLDHYGIFQDYVSQELSIFFREKPGTNGRYFLPIEGLYVEAERIVDGERV